MPESDVSVHVRDLNHDFPLEGGRTIKVLEGNNLVLRRGEIVIMMGRAGAGKTTLLTLIGALRRVQQGSLKVTGRELHGMSDRQIVEVRRRIGFVFQRHNLFESLTARRNVAMGADGRATGGAAASLEALRDFDGRVRGYFEERLRGLEDGGVPGEGRPRGRTLDSKLKGLRAFVADRSRISQVLTTPAFRNDYGRSLLATLGLHERIDHKPRALSGGQRQRVAIARALVNRPDLILADEPTASLDEENGRVVAMLLQEHAKRLGCTIMLVTHDPQIHDIADRIVTMEAGRIIADIDVKQAVEICEFLSRCETFKVLTPEELREVADKMVREQHPAGTTIVRQGEPGDKFYLIRSGVAAVHVDGEGPESIVRVLEKGEVFGERALLSDQPRSATVRAAEDLELYALLKDDFKAALEASPPLEEQLRRVYQSIKISG